MSPVDVTASHQIAVTRTSTADRITVHEVKGAVAPGWAATFPQQRCHAVVQDLQDARLRLKRDLWVSLELADGIVSVWHDDLEELGTGPTEAEALAVFRASVVELYFLLKGLGRERMGPIPLKQWNFLLDIVEER